MAIITKPLRIPAGLFNDQTLVGFLQSVVDRVEKPRVDAINDLDQTISNPPTQAEVQAISDKIDEILANWRTSGILEP